MVISLGRAAVRIRSSLLLRALLLVALALGVFALVYSSLINQPLLDTEHATGLYRQETEGDTIFRWSSSRATFPLRPVRGIMTFDVLLKGGDWLLEAPGQLTIATDAGKIATVEIGPKPRRIIVALPPESSFVQLQTEAVRPSGGDWRWLGVQVREIGAESAGFPLRAANLALALALLSVPLAMICAWLIRRGYGPLVAVFAVGLALRLIGLYDSPPLMHRDEVVSLVDAWFVATTGHDHLGHFLPVASFEAYGDWISPMLTYLLLPWVAVFGPLPTVARLVTALFGALAIPLMYGFVRETRLGTAATVAAAVVACSPWMVFLSRVTIPPALVATMWTALLWAGLRFIRRGGLRDAGLLALIGGVAIYAYPTMKLTTPLLGLAIVVLAIRRHGWRAIVGWLPAAGVILALWLPFLLDTLLNPTSGARLSLIGIKADSAAEWLAAWWANYSVYFQPNLLYGDGGVSKVVQAVPNHGLGLLIEAPLLAGWLVVPLLAWLRRRSPERLPASLRKPIIPADIGLLLLGALLIAPIGASLTNGNPNAFRASMFAPTYAALVGLGAGIWWGLLGALPARSILPTRAVATVLVALALVVQCNSWFAALRNEYSAQANDTWFYADGEIDAMQRVVAAATQYDEVLVDTASIGRPYIFLLLVGAAPPAEVIQQIQVERHPPEINRVTSFGNYRFADFPVDGVPDDLPALEAIPTSDGSPGYLLQPWLHNGKRVLVVRGMTTHLNGEE